MARVKSVNFGGMSSAELKAQQEQIQRRQTMIDALRQSSMTQDGQQTANGRVLPVSPWASLAKVGQVFAANRAGKETDKSQAALSAETAKRTAQALKAMAPAGVFPGTENYTGPMARAGNTPAPAVPDATRQNWARALKMAETNPEMGGKMVENLMQSSMNQPSNVQEWEYFSKLPPEQQEQYLTMRRGSNPVNLGDQIMIPSAVNPAGAPRATFDVGLRPQDTPEVRGQQAAAVEAAKTAAIPEQMAAETQGLLQRGAAETGQVRSRDALSAIELLDMAEPLLDVATGSGVGVARDKLGALFGLSGEGAQAAAELASLGGLLVSKMPRMEGPQSNLDQQLYREMAGQVGDATIPGATRKAALQKIRELNQKYASAQAAPAVDAPPQTTRRRYNPATGEFE